MYRDLKLIETGSGGEILINAENTDIVVLNNIQNEPYLSWFGGNAYVSEEGQWWGNNYPTIEPEAEPLESLTETAIRENDAGSRGRLVIQDAATDDLSLLSQRVDIDVLVVIESVNKLSINALITDEIDGESSTQILINTLI